MPTPVATLDVDVNSSRLSRQVADALGNGVSTFQAKGGIKLNGNQFLGTIGGMNQGVKDFDSSLTRATQRVVSFGTAFAVIGGSVRAFQGIIAATRDVEKSIAKIGSVTSLTAQQSGQLLNQLSNVAVKTSQSFDDAAESVEKFAKQGGTLAQTLNRAQIALGLAKVGGLEATKATDGLIAAYSNFSSVGETYLTIANKISVANKSANVEVKDLIEGIGQFGAEAVASGISLNKLVGIIASVKQATGQSGSAPIQRVLARVQQNAGQLSGIIETRDKNGQTKEGLQLLTEYAQAYKNLNQEQQRIGNKALAGIFSPNVLQVLIKDLGDINGLSSQIDKNLSNSQNALSDRITTQTKNLDDALKNFQTRAGQAGKIIGELSIKPAITNALSGLDITRALFHGISTNGDTKFADNWGVALGESILKGIGNVLSGPGLAILARVVGGTVARTFPNVLGDFKQAAGFGAAKQQDLSVLRGINSVLAQATTEEVAQYRAAASVTEQHRILNQVLQRQLQLMAEINAERTQALQGVGGGSLRNVLGKIGRGAAGGYIPSALSAESSAISMGIGGAPSSARPVVVPHFAFGGGVTGPLVANTSEYMVHGAGGSTIYNREMIGKYGLPAGATPIAAGGYVPNAASGDPLVSDTIASTLRKSSPLFPPQIAGQDALAVFQKGLTGLIKKGFDLSGLDLNVPQEELRKSVRGVIVSSLQVPSGALTDPKVKAALSKVTTATIEAQANRIAYNQALQKQSPNVDLQYSTYGKLTTAAAEAANARQLADAAANRNPLVNGTGLATRLPNLSSSSLFFPIKDEIQQRHKIEEEARVNRTRLQEEAEIAEERQRKRNAYGNRLQVGLIAADAASSFLPDSITQTTGGKYGKAVLSGAATGASLGSIIPGIGTGIGGAIGGFLGGIAEKMSLLKEDSDKAAQALKDLDDQVKATAEHTKEINLKKITDAIDLDLEKIQDSIAEGSGQASFLRRSSSQRLRGVSEVLRATGPVRGTNGKLVDSVDVESSDRLQDAQAAADANTLQARKHVQEALISQIRDKAGFLQERARPIEQGVVNATSSGNLSYLLKNVSSAIGDKETKSIERLIQKIDETEQAGAKEVALVREQIGIQRQLLDVEKQSVLLSRGTFNTSNGIGYRGFGAATGGFGATANAAKISSVLQQSEFLDSLGLPRTANGSTDTLQFKLKQSLVRSQLSNLSSRELGYKVGTDDQALLRAATTLQGQGQGTRRQQLGGRIEDAVPFLNLNPKSVIKNLLSGQASLSDIQKGVQTGGISTGEAAIVAALSTANTSLDDITKNTASVANGGKTPPADGTAKKPYQLPAYNVNESGPLVTEPTKQSSQLSEFFGGFGDQLDSLNAHITTTRDIGIQSADDLTKSFGKFFGDFATGAARGQNAFREFASSIFANISRLFANQAAQQIFGGIGTLFGPSNKSSSTPIGDFKSPSLTPTTSYAANGGYMHLASGGGVPALLTGGEYVFGPEQARRLGPQTLSALNSGRRMGYAVGGLVQGGSGMRDDVPALLPQGSYVIKKSAVNRLGSSYLSSMAGGGYSRRADGGGLGSDFEYGGLGALFGGLLGLLLDKKNRGRGALIGAGVGFGAGFLGRAAFNPNAQATGKDAISLNKAVGDIGKSLAISAGLGGISSALTPKNKLLDFEGVRRNATQLEANSQSNIDNRPYGSFPVVHQGNLIDYTGGANSTPYGYSEGGYSVGDIGGGSVGPTSSGGIITNHTPVTANIEIHNYGQGNQTTSTSSQGGGDIFGKDFANQITKQVQAIVDERLVNAQRAGASNQLSRRYAGGAGGSPF